MRFPPQLLDEIRARLPVSQVVARKVALKKAGREFRGLSPFKTERTPSFFVNDQKGFYHCFASGEHGDIFTFLMKTEGVSFPEAVERLAAEAGVTMPKREMHDPGAVDARARLYDLVETAARFFEQQLRGPTGREARAYLERRGVHRETLTTFRLGYAPASRTELSRHLKEAGFTSAEMISAGMVIAGDDIPAPYDRFRHRVMFPIADLRGRIIAFGGRALDPDAPAKYLNSPETPLFHKGSVLFNGARARGAAHDSGALIVVEGYMDVVALHEAGLPHAVAPLGTALTEDQARLLWRMVPEPVLCFDGDGAGRKAAHRALDVMLPHLGPSSSATFAFLPDGLDPDDMVRQHGAAAFSAVVSRSRPLADVLWEREWAGGEWATPERRARLERQVLTHVARIGDPAVRRHYEQAMRQRLRAAWGHDSAARYQTGRDGRGRTASPAGRAQSGGVRRTPSPSTRNASWASQGPGGSAISSSLKGSALVSSSADPHAQRETLLMLTLLNHPWLLAEQAEAVAALDLKHAALIRLRDALLSVALEEKSLDRPTLRTQLEKLSLGKVADFVERTITHKSDRFTHPDAERHEVEAGFRHVLAFHEQQSGVAVAMMAATLDWQMEESEDALQRIVELHARRTGSHDAEVPPDA